MPHELILGMTGTGKTTLALKKAQAYKNKGINIIVFDPQPYANWPTQYIFGRNCGRDENKFEFEKERFLNTVFKSKCCAVFVDESGRSIGRNANDMTYLASESRNNGHNCHFIAQRAKMIDVNVRNNCAILNMFRQVDEDCIDLYKSFGAKELKEGNSLPDGEFIYVKGLQVSRHTIFSK